MSKANALFNVQFGAGGEIFREGDSGDCAYVVEKGCVEICRYYGDDKVVVAMMEPGDIFGEMGIIDDSPRSATAIAMEATSLTVVTREQITTRLAEADPVLGWLLRVILERFRHSMQSNGLDDDGRLVRRNAGEAGIMHDSALDDIKLEGELRRALDQNEFVLYYQPIVDLRRQTVAGFETLIRWNHPTRGLLSPYFFVGVAERTDLIVPIGMWVIEEACRHHQALQAAALAEDDQAPLLFLGVNLSGRQFSTANFVETLSTVVEQHGLEPQALKLEITETMLVNYEAALNWVQRSKEYGFTVALDDFGTGYSSLSYLNRFPIDTLKIDRSFIMSMLSDTRSMVIVDTMLSLARGLGMTTVAEGVEELAELQALVDRLCDYGQGYLLSRPLPLEKALALLRDPTPLRSHFDDIHLPMQWRSYGR